MDDRTFLTAKDLVSRYGINHFSLEHYLRNHVRPTHARRGGRVAPAGNDRVRGERLWDGPAVELLDHILGYQPEPMLATA